MRILAQFRLWVNFCESILEEPCTFTYRVNFLIFFSETQESTTCQVGMWIIIIF